MPPGTTRLLLSLVLASLSGCSVASTCASGTVSCGGTCVETRADNLNCGACGNKCPVGTACSMGACEASCRLGQVTCGGACVDPRTNATACGARGDCLGTRAGSVCGSGQTCQGGACVCASAGQVACGGACVDPRTDAAHCGASGDCSGASAGTACGAGPTCQEGICVQFTAPTITTQPTSQTVESGRAATFTVTATGTAPLHYQWMQGSVQIGADAATLTIVSALTGDAGTYTVIVSNEVGSQVSAAATLTVNAPATGIAWSDEFDGPEIDSSKWAFDLGNGPTNPGPLYGWGNGEWEYYTSSRDNAAIENGSLVITARRQDWGGRSFTSARLVTRGKYSFRQGRFVARIKMPEGNRMWPAFWLLGDRVESWPMCGEVDIAEMFAGAVGRGDDAVFATAHWWDDTTASHGMNGVTYTIPAKLSADFHDYELEWDDHFMRGKIDGHEYWTLDITAPAMSELRDNFYYIVLNLAVGSPGFGMTSADQANGPLPQRMYVDYVRVYSNTGSTVEDKVASQPHGRFGILADGTATDSQIDLATDANLYLWNNLVAVKGTPAAGATSLAFRTLGTSWFGFGYAATKRRNLLNYAAGYLNVSIKTISTNNFKVGINGGNDGDAWVDFVNGSDPSGFVRDGQWHKVSIPMTRFGNADFSDIRQFFMVAGSDAVTAGAIFEFDEIYWSENAPENIVHPVGARFGVYTDRVCDAGAFNPATDGGVFIWNPANGAVLPGVPFEGASAIAFSAPGAAWYGLGLAPTRLHDLSAFARGHLHVALKVPSSRTADFKIGVKSPGGMAVRESWIKFKSGSDPYGMVRDGRYHELLIPAADFGNSDFGAISQLFMLAGDGPGSVEFDDVYWTAE